MLQYGRRVAPLRLIGAFLNFAGNAILNDIHKRFKRRVFFAYHRAISVSQIQNQADKYWLTVAEQIDPVTKEVIGKVQFRSNKVVLATGAYQPLPKSIIQKYQLRPETKVFTSDEVLKLDGFTKLVQLIRQKQGKCKIMILGGSHSGFSVLYLLLQGPARIGLFEEVRERSQSGNHQRIQSSSL